MRASFPSVLRAAADRYAFAALLVAAHLTLPGPVRAETPDAALQTAIDGPWRDPANRARDAFRHPSESLAFWGLKPGMTIVEVDPGAKGWWTQILAPYARATHGAYVAALPDRAPANSPDNLEAMRAAFFKGVADSSIYREVEAYDFGPERPDFRRLTVLLERRSVGRASLSDAAVPERRARRSIRRYASTLMSSRRIGGKDEAGRRESTPSCAPT